MSDKYKTHEPDKAYFITMTTVGCVYRLRRWIDIFTRKNHKLTIVNSLKYCQKEKGLVSPKARGWVLIPIAIWSHLHLMPYTKKQVLSFIIGINHCNNEIAKG